MNDLRLRTTQMQNAFHTHIEWSKNNPEFSMPTAGDCLRYACQEVIEAEDAEMRERLTHLRADRESNYTLEIADTLVMLFRFLYVQEEQQVTLTKSSVVPYETLIDALVNTTLEGRIEYFKITSMRHVPTSIYKSLYFISLHDIDPYTLVEMFHKKIESKRLLKL